MNEAISAQPNLKLNSSRLFDVESYRSCERWLKQELLSLPSSYPRDYQGISPKSMEVIRVLPELRNTKMIDLGCNFGLYSLLAARFAAQVVGIDINQEFIDIANRSKELLIGVGFAFDNVVFSRRFVSSLRRGEFNSMLLACVLYHLSDKEVAYLQSYISENCTRVVVQCRPDRDKHFSSGKIVEYASANNQYGALYRPEDASEFLRKAGMSVDIYSSGELFYGETFPVVIGKK